MKQIMLGVSLLALSSCSRAYIKQWDRDSVVACCPHGKVLCTNDKLDELAASQCGGTAQRTGGGMIDSGASVTNAWGGLQVRNTQDSCLSYQCGPASAAPASVK